MPDSNVPINAPTTVGERMASFQDAALDQHEKMVVEYMDGTGQPQKVDDSTHPFPVVDAAAEAALASIAAEDFATSAKQSDGSQKTQIVDGSGNVIGSTANALNVNVTAGSGGAVTIADGADVTEGAIADAIVAAGAAGTLSAKLRRVTQGLEDLKTLISVLPLPSGASTSSNQILELTALGLLLTTSDFDTKTGSLTETAPATDTASSGLNGRLQRIAQRLTSLIAILPAALGAGGGLKVDGSGTALPISGTVAVTGAGDASAANQTSQITQETAINTVLGLIADATVAAGATGSVSAKLRRATQGLEDLKTLIVLAAGANIIGKVGIDQTTPGTTNLVALTAETTKAIGVVRNSDGAGNLLTSNSTTYTAKFGLDGNLLGTLGTAFSTPGKVDVKSTLSFTDATVVVAAVTALQSLGNSATVGWQGVLVKNHVTKYSDFKIWVKLTTANTAPANDKAMYLWIIPWYTSDNGTTFNPSSIGTTTLPTGTDAAITIASPHNMRLLGVLNYTTAQATVQDNFLLSNCFGNAMPDGWSPAITNFSGAILSTGCVLDYTGITNILI